MSRLFNLLVSEKTKREEIACRQEWERAEMRRQQREAEAIAKAKVRNDQKDRIAEARERYAAKAEQMLQRQEASRERLKKRQQSITKERNAALSQFRIRHPRVVRLPPYPAARRREASQTRNLPIRKCADPVRR